MIIKSIFRTHFPHPTINAWLVVLRICIAAFMLTHGIPKLEKLMAGGEIKFADPIGVGPTASLVLTVFSECVCSVLLLLGFATRLTSIFLVITMAVAAFIAHAGAEFKDREPALMYLLIYITLFVLGAGKYSLDEWITAKLEQ